MLSHLHRTVALTLLAAALLALASPAAALTFTDVSPKDWFLPAVNFAVGQGLFAGVAPDRFAPQTAMSRGMFYTVLARMSQAQVNDAQGTNLEDVPQGQWFTGSVIWALSNNLTSCRETDRFGVNEPISRAEICTALARYDRYSGANRLDRNATTTFTDIGKLDPEETMAVACCQKGRVVKGRSDGRFDPYAGASRAEVAEMIKNYCALAVTASGEGGEIPWDASYGWRGVLSEDFPLAGRTAITQDDVLKLNRMILCQNVPSTIAPFGSTLDGDEKHLTNFGTDGIYDCVNVVTNRLNKNNEVDAGVSLKGFQEYYGYSLQTKGIARQDEWHQEAQKTGKDPWQCTWWVWGRAAQFVREWQNLDFRALCDGEDNFGHGKSYYNGLKKYFKSDQVPAPNSIISWSCGTYGHVAYVESVDESGGIWVSMADSGHTWRGVTYIPRADSEKNPYPLHWYPSETLNGFNHLDQPTFYSEKNED